MHSVRRFSTLVSVAVLVGLSAAIAATSPANAATSQPTYHKGDTVAKYQSSTSEIFVITSSGQATHMTSAGWTAYKASEKKAGVSLKTTEEPYGFARKTGTSPIYTVWSCSYGYSATHETPAQYAVDGRPTPQGTSLTMKASLCYSSPGKLAYVTND